MSLKTLLHVENFCKTSECQYMIEDYYLGISASLLLFIPKNNEKRKNFNDHYCRNILIYAEMPEQMQIYSPNLILKYETNR